MFLTANIFKPTWWFSPRFSPRLCTECPFKARPNINFFSWKCQAANCHLFSLNTFLYCLIHLRSWPVSFFHWFGSCCHFLENCRKRKEKEKARRKMNGKSVFLLFNGSMLRWTTMKQNKNTWSATASSKDTREQTPYYPTGHFAVVEHKNCEFFLVQNRQSKNFEAENKWNNPSGNENRKDDYWP